MLVAIFSKHYKNYYNIFKGLQNLNIIAKVIAKFQIITKSIVILCVADFFQAGIFFTKFWSIIIMFTLSTCGVVVR